MVQKTIYKTKDYSKVKFSFTAENAETIEVLGLNGDWEIGVPMTQKKDGSFSCEVNLAKNAQYEFKYRVNGSDWYNDAEADGTIPNSFGGSNCIINL